MHLLLTDARIYPKGRVGVLLKRRYRTFESRWVISWNILDRSQPNLIIHPDGPSCMDVLIPDVSPHDDPHGHEGADDTEHGDDGEDDALGPKEELVRLIRDRAETIATVVHVVHVVVRIRRLDVGRSSILETNRETDQLKNKLANMWGKLGGHHFLIMLHPLSPMAAKETAKATAQHKQEVSFTRNNFSVGSLVEEIADSDGIVLFAEFELDCNWFID